MTSKRSSVSRAIRLAATVGFVTTMFGACGGGEPSADHSVYFVGFAYDGTTGARLVDYSIFLHYLDATREGRVDDQGRYWVGPLPLWTDYTIEIVADGYRSFLSHNGMIDSPLPQNFGSDTADALDEVNTRQTFFFDAFLFPAGLTAPAVVIDVESAADDTLALEGQARLVPTASTELQSGATPAAVGGQVWGNDQDLQGTTVTKSFTGGEVVIDAGELVYGVTYRVSIFNVEDHQPSFGTLLQAGVRTYREITLAFEVQEPLEIENLNTDSCVPSSPTATTPGSAITITFNRDIELVNPEDSAEEADTYLATFFYSPNADADANVNTLNPDTTNTMQERGISIAVSGNTMTYQWNPSEGLATSDEEDPIHCLGYRADTPRVQIAGQPWTEQNLHDLLDQYGNGPLYYRLDCKDPALSCPFSP